MIVCPVGLLPRQEGFQALKNVEDGFVFLNVEVEFSLVGVLCTYGLKC